MVYNGPFSRGCERCRRRKIKCDQEKPICSQCIKAKHPCGGYRDANDFLFRDESNRVISKVKKAQQEKPTRNDATPRQRFSSEGSTPTPSGSSASASPSRSEQSRQSFDLDQDDLSEDLEIVQASTSTIHIDSLLLSPPIQDQAAAFFFQNFVVPRGPFSLSYRNLFSREFSQESSGSLLNSAVMATSIASMGNMLHVPQLIHKARREYGKAIVNVKRALEDPEVATKDSTLLSVIYLGLFEVITLGSWDQFKAWDSHVEGATALIGARGHEQFQGMLGLMMFYQVRAQAIYKAIQKRECIPETISKWIHVVPEGDPNHEKIMPALPLLELAVRAATIRASCKKGEAHNPYSVFAEAVQLDAEFGAYQQGLPPSWNYATIHPIDAAPMDMEQQPSSSPSSLLSSLCLEDHYHVYEDRWVATIWNHYRTLRIVNQDVILQCINEITQLPPSSPHPSPTPIQNKMLLAQSRRSKEVLHQTAMDICATIPQALMGEDCQAFDGMSLIWPLFVAGQAADERPAKVWIVERLEYIRNVYGIGQAAVLALALRAEMVDPRQETSLMHTRSQ